MEHKERGGSSATERERIYDEGERLINNAGERTGDLAQRVSERARQTADDLRTKDAGELIDDARNKAGDLAETARQKTSEATAVAADKVETAMNATGEQFSNLAQTVRERAPEGRMGDVATTAADAIERSGQYLQQSDLQSIRGDLERIIRERPIESLLVGLGVGYLLARGLRR